MAALGCVGVPCPECGDKVDIPLGVSTSSVANDGTLVVSIAPNVTPMAEHYTLEHCGASLEP